MPQGKGGGRPSGQKSVKTRMREADEQDPDGSQRAEKRANFFTPQFYAAHRYPAASGTTLSRGMVDERMTDHVPETTVPVEAIPSPPHAASPVFTADLYPDLPIMQDREENTWLLNKYQ